MFAWVQAHDVLLWWMGIVSVVMFFGTLALVPLLVARIPVDYFSRKRRSFRDVDAQSAWYIVGLLVKNVLGVLLILVGIAMLVLPGQGVLTILLGLFVMNFPGKRALERSIVSNQKVLSAINWMRARSQRPPLEI